MHDLILRPLSMADAQALFMWRNDPDTCRFSKDPNPAVWENHVKWFTKRVQNLADGETYRIAMNEAGISVGLVWMTEHDGTIEVHYRIDPNYRNQGIGTHMVDLFVQNRLTADQTFVCPIIVGNEPSEKLAAKFGLVPGEPERVNPDDDTDDRMIRTWARVA